MKTRFNFKETVWREVVIELTEVQKNEVFEMVSSGEIENCDDLYDYLFTQGIDSIDNSFNYETSSPISKQENGGEPTIEVYENGNLTFLPNLTN